MEMRSKKRENIVSVTESLKKTAYENYQPLSWITSSSKKPPKTNLPNRLKYFVSTS